jgi:enoyl-CoA hydratase/carnithine racemase
MIRYEQIVYEVDDPVATITLNRPQALNAFTNTMAKELRDAVGRAERDRSVVGIVLTGAGRGFSAGADINWLSGARTAANDPEDFEALPFADHGPMPGDSSCADLRGTYTYLLSVRKPIIAAVNGPVAGMSVPIALACDIRFMNEDAILSTPFARFGLVAEWGASWLLGRLVGPAHALDLLYSGRQVTGTEAAQMGLVNRALPAADVLPAAQEYVKEIALHCSPLSMAVIKQQVYAELHAGLGAAERDAIELMKASLESADHAEGVLAYQQRREPKFERLGDRRNDG